MASAKDDDPFEWDVDRVVKELCTTDRTWVPTANAKLGDLDQLERKLREADCDGEVLLDLFDHESDLWSCLGITTPKPKMAIRTAITQLRKRSRGYQKYKADTLDQIDLSLPQDLTAGATTDKIRNTPSSMQDGQATAKGIIPDTTAIRTPSEIDSNGRLSAAEQAVQATPQGTLGLNNYDSSEPPKKKQKRLPATQLTTIDQPVARETRFSMAPVLMEADVISASRIDMQTSEQHANPSTIRQHDPIRLHQLHRELLSKPGAFWGNGKLSSLDITGGFNEKVDDERSFGFGQPTSFGRARKAFVNGKIKGFFRGPSRLVVDDEESALPVLGESDDDDNPEWDDIERELEEEREEVRREKEELAKLELSASDVDTCIGSMVDETIALWKATQVPKLQHQALRIWEYARRREVGVACETKKLSASLLSQNMRLDNKLQSLRDNTYKNERELRSLGPALEPTINEIERLKWCIDIVRSPDAPQNVSPLRRPRSGPRRPAEAFTDGIDIWTDDDMEDFVVDDNNDDGVVPTQDSPHPIEIMDINTVPTTSDATVSDPANHPTALDPAQSFSSTSDVTIYDLTGVGSTRDPINLVTPVKPTSKRSSPLVATQGRADDLLPYSAVENIAKATAAHWLKLGDWRRLLILVIFNLSDHRKKRIMDAVIYATFDEVWDEHIVHAFESVKVPLQSLTQDSRDKIQRDTATLLARLFEIFVGIQAQQVPEQLKTKFRNITDIHIDCVVKAKSQFPAFHDFVRDVAPSFGVTIGDESDAFDLISLYDDDDDPVLSPAQKEEKKKKKKQKLAHGKSALLRREEAQESQSQNVRRLLFREALATDDSVSIPREKIRLIINESKLEGQGLIFINDNIAPKIKDHQIDGVRFLWNEIIKETKAGALLSHTMGMGKTMQVITLMVALREAAMSDDDTIRSQLPDHLKISKTLVLCPPGILDNWVEELERWAPNGILGHVYYVKGDTIYKDTRAPTIQEWSQNGGVLVVGYKLFSTLPNKRPDLFDILRDEPSLVIGDEAHTFKNRDSGVGRAANSFKTRSRIALTGSPLANNANEYYSLINWVSPGFLGEPQEFRAKYGNPIEKGLDKNAQPGERRKAKVCLSALKRVVGPKVQRRTIADLKNNDMPSKTEYIIYLDLGEAQKNAYNVFASGILRTHDPEEKIQSTSVWSLASSLRLLLAHPTIAHDWLQRKQELATDASATQAEDEQSPPADDQVSDDDKKNPATKVLRAPVGVVSSTLAMLKAQQTYEAIQASYKMLVLDKILEEALGAGDNVLVFSQSLDTLNYVESTLCRAKQRVYQRLDGNTAASKRQYMVNVFNKGTSQVFLISTTAGGVGLNIYGANRVVILDFKENPQREQQAIGRAYRIGQTKDVFVYWLIYDGTFEKVMQNIQIFKNQLASQVVDQKNPLPKADQKISVWFKEYQEKPHEDLAGFRGKDFVLDSLLLSEKFAQCISSIETTESFEEEEPVVELAEDDKLAADMLVAGQIRNPSERLGQQQPKSGDDVRPTPVLLSTSPILGPNPEAKNIAATGVCRRTKAWPDVDVVDAFPSTEVFGRASAPPELETVCRISPPLPMLDSTRTEMDSNLIFNSSHSVDPRANAFMQLPLDGGRIPPSSQSLPPQQRLILNGNGHSSLPAHQSPSLGGSAAQQSLQTLAHNTAQSPILPDVAGPQQQKQQQQQQPAPSSLFGSIRTEDGQVPMPDYPVLSRMQTTEPMMMDALVRRGADPAPSKVTLLKARAKVEQELLSKVARYEAPKVKMAMEQMEQHVNGDLPTAGAWMKVARFIPMTPELATAIVNGRPELLKDVNTSGLSHAAVERVLLGQQPVEEEHPRKKDPNVGNPLFSSDSFI